MACFSGYGYDNSYSGYFGGLTHHGYNCWCNAGSFGSAYDFGYPYSSYGYGDFANGFFGFNDFGYAYGDCWNIGLSLDSTAALPLFSCSTQFTDFSAFKQLCNNKKTLTTNNLTKCTLPTAPATPTAPAATTNKNFTFGNCFQNFAIPQLRAPTQKQPQKLEPPKLQQPLAFAQFPSFPNQIGFSTRLDFSTLTKVPQATKTSAPAAATAALPQCAFPTAAALPQFAFPTVPASAPTATAAPAPKPATLPQYFFPTACAQAGFQFPNQQMYTLPWGTWPPAAPAAAPSITLAKPAKSGKEAKPAKSIREAPANTIETELQKRVDEAPATRTIKELPAKSIVDDKSKNLKLIEGIILASKNQGRRFATDGSLELADILDFYEFLREKKRRINIAKLLD